LVKAVIPFKSEYHTELTQSGSDIMHLRTAVNLGNLLLSLSEITDSTPAIAQHQLRTAFIALEISKVAGVDRSLTEDIFAASLLHDIGALTVEEKIALHQSEDVDSNPHCIRGSLLLGKTSWFSSIAPIVRFHHTPWNEWHQPITSPMVFASQVIYLADFVERLIDRNQYILYQHQSIIDQVSAMRNISVHQEIIDAFLEVSRYEEFWLDLDSSRLYSSLFYEGPYRHIEIDIQGVSEIAKLFRDIIDFKSSFTATHTAGVAACAAKMGAFFGFTPLEVTMLEIAGNLHDIGKLIIPNAILEKPGKLTENEYALIKSHTYYTYHTIHNIKGLEQIAHWAAMHHERLDGSGYPFHYNSSQLDIGARIMAVADIFTALSEDRPYRKGMPQNEIYQLLNSQVRQNYIDGKIVALLFDHYDEINTYVRENQEQARQFYERRFKTINFCHTA